ncbi:MAG: hypothetical protein IJ523_12255 [Succinivibrionaceae bacterium]|nr:hypothetical protein [Succinivibrionaceae bacterium]
MTDKEIVTVIDGEYDEWLLLKRRLDIHATIADRVQILYCDTRDFALGWNFKQPEPYKKATCGLEVRSNEGLHRMEQLKASGNLEGYLIKPEEILPWLDQLCEKSGGYDEDWRMLNAKVEGCRDWDIKYIRFARHEDGRFIVCNGYWWPIEWRKVLDNLHDPLHDDDEDYKQRDRDIERMAEQAAPLILTNPYAHLHEAPKPKPVYYDGPCCGRCKNRHKPSDWCAGHYQQDRCYRFKLERR